MREALIDMSDFLAMHLAYRSAHPDFVPEIHVLIYGLSDTPGGPPVIVGHRPKDDLDNF